MCHHTRRIVAGRAGQHRQPRVVCLQLYEFSWSPHCCMVAACTCEPGAAGGDGCDRLGRLAGAYDLLANLNAPMHSEWQESPVIGLAGGLPLLAVLAASRLAFGPIAVADWAHHRVMAAAVVPYPMAQHRISPALPPLGGVSQSPGDWRRRLSLWAGLFFCPRSPCDDSSCGPSPDAGFVSWGTADAGLPHLTRPPRNCRDPCIAVCCALFRRRCHPLTKR